MPRQSISLIDKNDEWLRLQVNDSGEYSNKRKLVNDLIHRARRAETINSKLEKAEKTGFTAQTPTVILSEINSGIRR
ncbi:CopG family transcriptional regulator [Paraglaciecola sp. MB-3u-78]|jgi:antitoxin ParD1/3/4|uniref:CopG family transcriptional regulator n=1 Tax=Paraglaciecola sp. MB-3u-78 TaxID=2058332 RepID=UPI000C31BE35|nr:CopG family transcriptional regulator [Paraglaciecola sp. MB-3u-78]PKG98829.1 CopG family transcriptional regulator [Paraglaciecola sp. MB-3u-78]